MRVEAGKDVSSDRVRIAVVGCGAVAERYHLPALTASPDVELVAFVDRSDARARELAGRAGGGLVLSNHGELAGRVDAAIVAVPNALHAEVSTALLRAGVNVLVEKPMARTVQECDDMIAAAERAGVVLAVGHDFRQFPIARAVRALCASGVLGPVRRVDVRQGAGSRWPSVGADALMRDAGGGVLLTFGVHILDLLEWWLGALEVVASRDDAEGGVEAECHCTFQLAGGAPVELELSRRRSMRDTAVIECERGTLEVGIFEPAVLRLTVSNAETAVVGSVPDPEFERAPLRTVFARQLAGFIRAVRAGGPPDVSGADGRRVVSLVEQCYTLRHPLRFPWDCWELFPPGKGD
jgi:predicted dehydrogenase